MTISGREHHPAPTPCQPQQYALYFIPLHLIPAVEAFFRGLREPDDYFVLVPAMRIDQLAEQPDRIKRADLRSLTHFDAGVWVAFAKPEAASGLQMLLGEREPR